MSSNESHHHDFIKVLDETKLAIYAENHVASFSYDPKNDSDIMRLCKEASLHEFIKDTNQLYPELFIFKNKRYNLGVVTRFAIKKNQTICEYLGEAASLNKETTPARVKQALIKQNKIKKNISTKKLDALIHAEIKRITHYAFEVKANTTINDSILAHNKRSIAGFINHNATDPNVKSIVYKNTIYYKAARNIRKGEQLMIDYGQDYDYPDHLYYIPSTENHLSPGAFLAEHINSYYKKPIALTDRQREALQTHHHFMMVPQLFYKMQRSKTIDMSSQSLFNEIDKLNIRLPVYTFSECCSNGTSHQIHIPQDQYNYTALMLACTLQHSDLINALIKRCKTDIFAKTSHDLDALIVGIKSSESEESFLTFAKPLIKKIVINLDRTDSIGSDQFSKTALHLLVDRQWCKAIRLFNNAVFFDVVDADGYDPLISAIAYGKTKALTSLLKLKCIKKSLYQILFSEDETKKDFVLNRALKNIPHEKYNDIYNILLKAVTKRHVIKKKLLNFFKAKK